MPLPSASPHEQADEQLLILIEQKDRIAFEVLYDRHVQIVYSLIYRIVRNHVLAEELLQGIFWQVWCDASSFRGSGTVVALLLHIARTRALDTVRYRKVKVYVMTQTERSSQIPGSTRVAPSTRCIALDQRAVQQVLTTLTEEQRMCLEMSYFDGLTQREIAEQLNLTIDTIRSYMRSAMQKLARYLCY